MLNEMNLLEDRKILIREKPFQIRCSMLTQFLRGGENASQDTSSTSVHNENDPADEPLQQHKHESPQYFVAQLTRTNLGK